MSKTDRKRLNDTLATDTLVEVYKTVTSALHKYDKNVIKALHCKSVIGLGRCACLSDVYVVHLVPDKG